MIVGIESKPLKTLDGLLKILSMTNFIKIYLVEKETSYHLIHTRHIAVTPIVTKLGIKVAKEYLNHSDLKVTEIYAKVLYKQIEEAAEVL